jgi:AraC-like DNA-binding protein
MTSERREVKKEDGRAAGADPLAAIISIFRPNTVFSKIICGAGDWSIQYERTENPSFCVMLDGSCTLRADGIGVLELREGDFLLLPRTPGFSLATNPGLSPTLVPPTHVAEVHHGAPAAPPTVRMLGGYFEVDPANASLVVRLLPPVVHVRRADPGAERLRRFVELIGEEAGSDQLGSDLILERLVQLLLVESLRLRPGSSPRQERGLLAGLMDPVLARPLREMHRDVARRWTVAELARTAHLSRAVFAERFARKVGMPPMEYLLEWRMAIAKDLLRRERPRLRRVAEAVGYRSASAFSTAFGRLAGCSPSEFARGVPDQSEVRKAR